MNVLLNREFYKQYRVYSIDPGNSSKVTQEFNEYLMYSIQQPLDLIIAFLFSSFDTMKLIYAHILLAFGGSPKAQDASATL